MFQAPARPYSGSKLALIRGEDLLVYLRDEKPEIPFPGYWDLPGGGREGDELPTECAIRETKEEFGLDLSADCFVYEKEHDSTTELGRGAFFYVAPLTDAMVEAIQFGDEGQYWKLMKITDFLSDPNAPPHLKHRLAGYLVDRLKEHALLP